MLNVVDSATASLRDRVPAGVLVAGFGEHPSADVGAEAVVLDGSLRASFTLRTPIGSGLGRLGARGRHPVSNALAAAAAALAVGSGLDDIVAGLATDELAPARMDVVVTGSGATVINDAYNANPASMRAGIEALASLGSDGSAVRRRVAIIATMAELGPGSQQHHEAITRLATELGLVVIAVGEPNYGSGVVHVADHDTAIEAIGTIRPDDAFLVKGSLVAGLQVLAERLIALAGGRDPDGNGQGSTWSR